MINRIQNTGNDNKMLLCDSIHQCLHRDMNQPALRVNLIPQHIVNKLFSFSNFRPNESIFVQGAIKFLLRKVKGGFRRVLGGGGLGIEKSLFFSFVRLQEPNYYCIKMCG